MHACAMYIFCAAKMTLEILGPDGVVEGGGNQRRGGWCGVIGSLEKALELEVNPTRIPQVFTLSLSLSIR